MLSQSQIDEFKQTGALVLPGLFSPREAAGWRREVEAHFSCPKTVAEWKTAATTIRSSGFRLTAEPTPGTHPRLASVYRSLHSAIEWRGENQLLVRPPQPEIPWMGGAPHLDFPVAFPLRTLANITIYLSEIRPHGGAFMYWPGSHQVAWRHFHRHPEDYMMRGSRSQDQTFALILQDTPSAPVEFTGRPGDALIWNSLLLHAASTNSSDSPRIAVIGRWGAALTEGESHYDFERDPWAYWSLQPEGREASVS